MIKRILVGFDGSPQAKDALAVGSRLADGLGVRAILGASFSDEWLSDRDGPLDTALERESATLRANAAAELAPSATEAIEVRVISRESAADGLCDLAAAERADLIVIGSTHRGGVGRILPGSLALQMIGATPCPLAIAPRGLAPEADPARGPVIVAFDGTELAERAVAFAATVAAQAGTWLRLIGVAATPAQAEAALLGGVAPLGGILDKEGLQASIDAQLEKLPRALDAQGTVLEGSPVQALASSAFGPGGLVVAGSHGRGPLMSLLLGSVSDEIVKRVSWPVVLVPPQVTLEALEGSASSETPVTGAA